MSTRPYTFTFAAAGAGKLVTSRGTFWRVMSTSSPVDIAAFAEGREIARFSGAVTGTAWESLDERGALVAFDFLEVTSGSVGTLKIQVGLGRVYLDATTTSVAQGTTITDPAAVTVGVAATLLLAAGSGRTAARFYNAGTADVYLGGAGVTVAAGAVKLAPGHLWIEDDAADAAWYGVSAVAGQSVRLQVLA